MMSEPIRTALRESARHLCHYAGGPSSLNSCCQGVNRCEEKAAKVIRDFLRELPDKYTEDGAAFWDAIPREEDKHHWLGEAAILASKKDDQP